MGWWQQDTEGHSFADAMAGETIAGVWGDHPADLLDAAFDAIDAAFMEEWGRKPTRQEVEAGIKFSLLVRKFGSASEGHPVQQIGGMFNVVPGEDLPDE